MSTNVTILFLLITVLVVDGAAPPQLLVKLFVENGQTGQETISFKKGTNVEIAAKAVDNQIWRKQLKLFRASYHYENFPNQPFRRSGIHTISDPLAEIKAEPESVHVLEVEMVKDDKATDEEPSTLLVQLFVNNEFKGKETIVFPLKGFSIATAAKSVDSYMQDGGRNYSFHQAFYFWESKSSYRSSTDLWQSGKRTSHKLAEIKPWENASSHELILFFEHRIGT
ncbi:hypothetical protein Ddc_14854 [Ditylenchus destructor]|nr:hypothetical protein Ddc_14854 [Ditylenchus destructor]